MKTKRERPNNKNDAIRVHPLLLTSLEIARTPSNELLWNLTRHGGKFLQDFDGNDEQIPEWFGPERGLVLYTVTSQSGMRKKRRIHYGGYRLTAKDLPLEISLSLSETEAEYEIY